MYFGYDPLGRCVKRWFPDFSAPPTYMYYEGWSLIQEGNNVWSPTRLYVQGNRVDELEVTFNVVTSQYGFHQYDARGHCILTTDIGANMMEQYEYDAFGYPYFYGASGNWLGDSPHGNRFLFTGREWLGDLGVYDYRNRLYHPELGRFLQPDPKEFGAGDYNLYRYCHNDPVNHTDPDGLAMFGLYDSYGDYLADVGQVFIGEAKGAGNILSLGIYQPSYPNDNQRYGGYVGPTRAVAGGRGSKKKCGGRDPEMHPPKTGNTAQDET